MKTQIIVVVAIVTTLGSACASVHTGSHPAGSAIPPAAAEQQPFEPFGIPKGEFRCRPKELHTPRRDLLGFQFEDGVLMVNDRLISAVYDSLGRPVLEVTTATQLSPDGRPTMRVFSVSFPIDSAAHGFRVLHPETDDRATEPLSAESISKARELALWLWRHRCTGATQPAGSSSLSFPGRGISGGEVATDSSTLVFSLSRRSGCFSSGVSDRN